MCKHVVLRLIVGLETGMLILSFSPGGEEKRTIRMRCAKPQEKQRRKDLYNTGKGQMGPFR
jgi:hypothetical protein